MGEAEDSKIGKQVRLILTNNFHYSGIVLQASPTSITIKDKFGKAVTLNTDSIMVMEEA